MTSATRPRSPGQLDEGEAADLVLSGTLRWIESQVEWFAPERWEQHLPRRPFRPGPLLELLGLVRILERADALPPTAPLRTKALDLAERAVAERSFEAGLRAGDDFLPYHLNLIALLEQLGRPQPALRTVGQALLTADSGGLARPYKPVFNRLELRYFADRGGFTAPPHLPEAGVLHRQSIAALDPDVLQLSESETYALTHVVFYATDFGRKPLLLDGDDAAARLRESVRILLGVRLARGSLDLLAELLVCESALRTGTGSGAGTDEGTARTTAAAWNTLTAAVRPDGAVPGPVHRPDVMTGLRGDKAAAYLFGTCYHTTTVAALAAAVRRNRPRERTAAHGPAVPPAESDHMRAWAHEVTTSAASSPPGLQRAWAAQLDSLLVVAAQDRALELLADLLHAATALGRADRPVPRRAAELLAAWTH
ncbi:DUF6895 family protein [Streptomyces candidus]|uniref:DUF6895 domain-containing protein n=1 Tax=Streptomyces candidus TaxID=67283 RepID=A0A7X0LNQ5_9ACTN|nr:hypothetical protein [Streptomyces candidus]MBB6435117.1 hypothetical protein [Streptomyces candidus]GHH40789.1 hypothetical protein GCM10018773_22510 [Streptomyces candidus]